MSSFSSSFNGCRLYCTISSCLGRRAGTESLRVQVTAFTGGDLPSPIVHQAHGGALQLWCHIHHIGRHVRVIVCLAPSLAGKMLPDHVAVVQGRKAVRCALQASRCTGRRAGLPSLPFHRLHTGWQGWCRRRRRHRLAYKPVLTARYWRGASRPASMSCPINMQQQTSGPAMAS